MQTNFPDTHRQRISWLVLISLCCGLASLVLLLRGESGWAAVLSALSLPCLLLIQRLIHQLTCQLQQLSEVLHQCRKGNLGLRVREQQASHQHESGYLARQLNSLLDLVETSLEQLRQQQQDPNPQNTTGNPDRSQA
jgi:hypothetical protein